MVFSMNTNGQVSYTLDSLPSNALTMQQTETRAAKDFGSQYYDPNTRKPYTGVLYGLYDHGELMTVQQYVDGIGNGYWMQFNPDGTLAEKGTYRNNKVEGPVTQFYEDGSVKAEGQYRHWKLPIGLWRYYDRNGQVVHSMTYTR